MSKDFFNKGYDRNTKTKLNIFDKYFNEAFPVFVHSPNVKEIFICDFFAGQGKDEQGNFGTSLNILDSIKKHCVNIVKNSKKVLLILNDKNYSSILQKNVTEYLENCKTNCKVEKCIFSLNESIFIRENDFNEYFLKVHDILIMQKYSSKIIFIDPFGIEINDEIFLKLVNLPKTDFICFIPSSFPYRFETLNIYNIDFKNTPFNLCHKMIAKHFEDRIPTSKEYYISHFSIQKENGIYGLIFGTNHSLGAEKFLKICWKIDKTSGEATFNINKDLCYINDTLFPELNTPSKLVQLREVLESKVLNKIILSNKEAYIVGLKMKCLPKHVTEIIKDLISKKRISEIKTINNNIHQLEVQNFDIINS